MGKTDHKFTLEGWFEGHKGDDSKIELPLLRILLTEYIRQQTARRQQGPWLVLGVFFFIAGFIAMAWDTTHLRPVSWTGLVCFIVAVAAMMGAGFRAEGDPPVPLQNEAIEALKRYAAKDDAAKKQLEEKITRKEWRISDLVDFVNHEINSQQAAAESFQTPSTSIAQR